MNLLVLEYVKSIKNWIDIDWNFLYQLTDWYRTEMFPLLANTSFEPLKPALHNRWKNQLTCTSIKLRSFYMTAQLGFNDLKTFIEHVQYSIKSQFTFSD